jgi:hypothetical protein
MARRRLRWNPACSHLPAKMHSRAVHAQIGRCVAASPGSLSPQARPHTCCSWPARPSASGMPPITSSGCRHTNVAWAAHALAVNPGNAHTCGLKQSHTRAHAHARTHARTHTHTHAHARARAHARTHTHAHARTHAHNTHTHTHARKHTTTTHVSANARAQHRTNDAEPVLLVSALPLLPPPPPPPPPPAAPARTETSAASISLSSCCSSCSAFIRVPYCPCFSGSSSDAVSLRGCPVGRRPGAGGACAWPRSASTDAGPEQARKSVRCAHAHAASCARTARAAAAGPRSRPARWSAGPLPPGPVRPLSAALSPRRPSCGAILLKQRQQQLGRPRLLGPHPLVAGP